MNIAIVTDVSSEPLSIEEIKEHVNYKGSNTSELNELLRMQKSARELCEDFTDRAFATKTIDVFFDRDYDYEEDNKYLTMPMAPTQSITSVYSVSNTGTETLLTSGENYNVIGVDRKRIYVPYYVSTSDNDTLEYIIGYKVRLVVGYTTNLPSIYKDAMLKTVAEWYNNKDNYVPEITDQVAKMLSRWGDR